MRLILSLVLLAIAAAPLHAAEPVTSLPYRTDYNGWFTVGISVNGQGPYDFIIDTGATRSLIFQNMTDKMDFGLTGGPPKTVLGLAAQGTFPAYLIGDLQIGSERFDDLVSVILPDWTIAHRPQGVLGLDFLRDYIVLFDAELGELRLYNKSDPPRAETRGWRKVNLLTSNFGIDTDELFYLKGRTNRTNIKFLLDLGASGTLINKAAATEILLSGSQILVRPAGDRRTRITDALKRSEKAHTIKIARFRAGNAYWSNPIFVIYDAEIFEELGEADRPFGLFGADLVRNRSFSLDFEGGEMRIGPRIKR